MSTEHPNQLEILRSSPTGDLVGTYLALRNHRKKREQELEDELKDAKGLMAQIEGVLLDRLTQNNSTSERTVNGTVVRSHKVSMSLNDPKAFRDWVIKREAYDLVDWRANVPSVQQHIQENADVPPGLNISSIYLVQVRKA